MARFEAPVMNTSLRAPASSASSTAYWMRGLSTTGSISLGLALVAGKNRVPRPATGNTAVRITGCDVMLILEKSVPDGLIRAVIDPFAQVLAGLEMGYVFAGQCDGLAGLGIASLPRRPEVQREAAETPDLDALTLRQGIAHDLKNLLQRQLNVLGRQMLLLRRD